MAQCSGSTPITELDAAATSDSSSAESNDRPSARQSTGSTAATGTSVSAESHRSQSFHFSRSTDDESSPASANAQPPAPAVAPYSDAPATDKARPLRPRDKGIICCNYFHEHRCPIGHCPLAHVYDGELRPLPTGSCMFYNRRHAAHQGHQQHAPSHRNTCLRDTCRFFHGTKKQLRLLKESGATTYRPQDFMLIGSPWDLEGNDEHAPPMTTSSQSSPTQRQ